MTPPIIGALDIEEWFITLLIKCNCGKRLFLIGAVGATRQCTECKRTHRLNRMPDTHPVTGELTWAIGTALPRVGDES